MSRRKARETALMVIFQMDLVKAELQDALDFVLQEFAVQPSAIDYARELASGVWEYRENLDGLIQRESTEWEVSRMAVVDRNILRLAVYEMFILNEVPDRVAINEAVELAKRFGGPESGKFVNGILGSLIKNNSSSPQTGGGV
ncbi:MAG: transcription antitermination factor NusB [Syntrophomonadaceae bacterium]|nr:transcription antitermination factor NusB [Syntrophomonadaceae bacterium]